MCIRDSPSDVRAVLNQLAADYPVIQKVTRHLLGSVTILLRNPDDPRKPRRIFGLSPREAIDEFLNTTVNG